MKQTSKSNGQSLRSRCLPAFFAALLLVAVLTVQAAEGARLEEARATDPIALGWMIGTPPPPDTIIRCEDGSFYRFPQWRWSFSHWREFRPTVAVDRGPGPTREFERAERVDLDAVTFLPIGGAAPMSWADSLVANHTDGIVIGTFMARGIHGQAIYVDPKAEMVIARFASHPLAGNVNFDPTSLPAYRAIAERLMGGAH